MQRRQNGWYLTLVATGGPPLRPDERLGSIRQLRSLRATPLRRDGWLRRDYAFDLERCHEGLPVCLTILAYTTESATLPFVPDVKSADAVLLFQSGPPTIDRETEQGLQQALATRTGSPPEIIETVPSVETTVTETTQHLRSLVGRTLEALREGRLTDFWALASERAAAKPDEDIFGALTADRMHQQQEGDLVRYLLNVTYERARRAIGEGRIQGHEEYDRRLGAEWVELFALNAVEVFVADSGLSSLFGARGDRLLEPDEISRAIRGYTRLGASTKAQTLRAALEVADENKLWDGFADERWEHSQAKTELEALETRFCDAEGEDIYLHLEKEIRRDPSPFILAAFEAEW